MTLTEFLLARYAEDEAVAREAGGAPWVAMETVPWVQVDPAAIRDAKWQFGKQGHVASADSNPHAAHIARHDPARVLADVEAKRRIVELHESWPVLAQQPPTFEKIESTDPNQIAMRASQQIMWLTEQEYRAKFGDEPPTTPVLRALAAVYADHEDYREEWKP